jgi:cell wall-associated NlpC family hydrolase
MSAYIGKQLTAEKVAQYAYQAGFRGEALITAVAISHAETAEAPFDTAARGDVGLEDSTWGASIGLWQIRSLRADMNTGRTRDEAANLDPATNARHAYTISSGGTNFTPWSTYNSGDYKAYLNEARTASSTAASAVTSTPATATSSDHGEPILAITAGSSGPDYPLTIGGRAATGELGEAIVGGTVDFSINAISQVSVELSDPDFTLHKRYNLQPDGDLHLFDLPYRIVQYTLKQGPGAPHITLTAQPEGVVQMRENSPAARNDISPTDYMQQIATAAGLKFVGEASAVAGSIGPAQVPDTRGTGILTSAQTTTPTRPESAWDIGQRLASVLGFYAFEAAGTFYFASANYLQNRGQEVQFSVDDETFGPSYGPVFRAMGMPTVTVTKQDLAKRKLKRSTKSHRVEIVEMNINITGTIARDEGINLRPTMRIRWTGIGPILTGVSELVTRVTWDLGSSTAPVTVESGRLPDKIGTGRTEADDTASTFGTSGTGGSTITVVGPKPNILDFVTECLRQVGNKYTWGGEDPLGGFDCSGLVEWAASQFGVVLPRTAGPQYAAVQKAGLTMTVEQAFKTRGAVLYRAPNAVPGLGEHIVVSLGDGKHTIEARGSAYGVVEGPITGRTWTGAGKLPGFTY